MKTISLKNATIADLLTVYTVDSAKLKDYSLPSYLWGLLVEMQDKPMTLHHIAKYYSCNVTSARVLLKELLSESIVQKSVEMTTHSRFSSVKKSNTANAVVSDVEIGDDNEFVTDPEVMIDYEVDSKLLVKLEDAAKSVVVDFI